MFYSIAGYEPQTKQFKSRVQNYANALSDIAQIIVSGLSVTLVALGALTMPALSDQPTTNHDTRASVPPQDLNTPRIVSALRDAGRLGSAQEPRYGARSWSPAGWIRCRQRLPLKATCLRQSGARRLHDREESPSRPYPGFYLCGNLYRPHGASVTAHPDILAS